MSIIRKLMEAVSIARDKRKAERLRKHLDWSHHTIGVAKPK
ncbi:hypothetical protein QKW60_09555 [Defluviimonas aestuarii]|nr:hypothetical protein [Defluviimonas aestuarii]MDI3336652.1 hypothetical protein [Defluviimonas aestuarii]